MDNRYTSYLTGENTEWEIKAIKKFFPSSIIEKITDKDRQYQGADYKVTIGKRHLYIDCKIHHFDSSLFVYECYDTRPAYSSYGWTNRNNKHITNFILWIEPFYNTAYLYDFNKLLAFQDNICFKVHNILKTHHENGDTVNKLYRHGFISCEETKVFDWNEKKPNVIIKHNKLDLSEYLI